MMKKSKKVVKKADGGMLPSIEGRPPPDLVPLAPPPVPLAGTPTIEEFDRAVRTAKFRDTNRNGIGGRDELMRAKRMNERIRAGMGRPRMDRRGMAMIGPEDERMMGMDTRMRNPRVPMRPYMPELNLDPEGIREYSRGKVFSPESRFAKGGKVTSKKSKAVKSSASRRADGIAKKGKTRGKFV